NGNEAEDFHRSDTRSRTGGDDLSRTDAGTGHHDGANDYGAYPRMPGPGKKRDFFDAHQARRGEAVFTDRGYRQRPTAGRKRAFRVAGEISRGRSRGDLPESGGAARSTYGGTLIVLGAQHLHRLSQRTDRGVTGPADADFFDRNSAAGVSGIGIGAELHGGG